jgi:hypothetical protein
MDIKTALDNIKAIIEIADSTKNIELKSYIVDLKEQILELKDENFDLKEQLRQRTEHNMIFENRVYWDLKEDGTKDGPYCPSCWDSEGKAVRLGPLQVAGPNSVHQCYVCKNTIVVKSLFSK